MGVYWQSSGTGEEIEYMEGLLAQMVQKIEAIQEEVAVGAISGIDIPPEHIGDQLDDLLKVETPSGETGTLGVDERGLSIMLGARITGERVISTRPGDFNGVVWSEEMDRPPREPE